MEKKTFAFKLADESARGARKWQARDGIALAGCSGPVDEFGNYRDRVTPTDEGYYC